MIKLKHEMQNVPWAYRNDPIFEINLDTAITYPNGDKLPSIFITEPIFDDENNCTGRTYTMVYPFTDHEFPYADYNDDDGEEALYYGGGYYEEGMSYTDPVDHDKRIDCFRAAEICYRHAAGKGNAVAYLCLGYVYSYDRCEGHYWVDPMTLNTTEDCKRPYPREHRAFECFLIAAEAGIPEACYKLGDLYKRGTGCEANAKEAFRWYAQASELAIHERPVILGSIALRLASCYEEGFGCSQDFSRALDWYEKAVAGLEVAVENGEVWYEKTLAGARAGIKRCKQEIAC